MSRLSLRLLGTLQVALDGQPVTGFESDKERALLAFLAEESTQAHRRERLAGFFWPEMTEAAARNNLRRVLSNLRRLLGDRDESDTPFLDITRHTVRFNPASDAWVDTVTFASLADPPGRQPVGRLEEAIRLYRGDFLEGMSLAGSPAFEEWEVLVRERYERMLLEALHHLVEVYQRQGRVERALRLAWKQIELEPWWEEANQQVIRLLAMSGRRSEALAQYTRCRRLLAEELGTTPSAETTTLYESVLDGTLVAALPARPERPAPIHNLPLAPGPFVGRDAEVRSIHDALRDPGCRLLTVVGAGGTGKTRLALEAVSAWLLRVHEHSLQGAYLVSLGPLSSVEAIVPAIAGAIDCQLAPDGEPRRQLLEHLSQRRLLLILDGFEHLLNGAGLVTEILQAAPHVKVVVTSRARLNLRGEHDLPLAGIGFPDQTPSKTRDAETFAAVELFLLAARQVRPGFSPTAADLDDICRICRQVQGMPLGLLLAAAWMGILNPGEIAAEIDGGLDFLAADWPDAPEGQRSMRAVFDRSWSLLAPREQEVFQALSVFVGGFTRAAAQQVAGASLNELKRLADRSLLQVAPSGRYDIHELLRQYASSKLNSQPDIRATIRDRHCAYFTLSLERWHADLSGSHEQAALVAMEAESENIRVAWAWAVEHAQCERLGRAMRGLEHYCWQTNRFREAGAALQAAGGVAANAADQAACLQVQVQALGPRHPCPHRRMSTVGSGSQEFPSRY